MSNEEHETIADIVREMRIGDLCANDTTTSMVYINDFLAGYADRIEAAEKREVAELERKVAEDALVKLQDRLVSSVHDGTTDPYEALKITEDALATIREKGDAK